MDRTWNCLNMLVSSRWEIYWTTAWSNCQRLGMSGREIRHRQSPLNRKKNWQTGLLGEDTLEQLFNTILYLIGLHFTLHAYDKHKNLCTGAYSQFKIKVDDKGWKYLEYTEAQSKNFQGGLKNLHQKPKVVQAYENVDDPSHCIVHLF